LLRSDGRASIGIDLPQGAGSDSFILAMYESWDVEKSQADELFSHVAYVIHRYLYFLQLICLRRRSSV